MSALTAHQQRPIPLVLQHELPGATALTIADLAVSQATLVGSEGAVSTSVQAAVFPSGRGGGSSGRR